MEDSPSPIDDYILRLTGKEKPHICFISTPSGDLPDHLEKFYAAFSSRCCEPSHLAFFRKPRPNALPLPDFAPRLLAQDAIFVGGGMTKSALAVWKEWGLDKVLKQAWTSGILLSGMSAGAMCWFQVGISDSFGDSKHHPLPCLGFIPNACATHYNGEPQRRPSLHSAVESGQISEALAIDDRAAVVFTGATIERVVSWQEGSTAYRVFLESGRAKEVAYCCESISIR